MGKMTDDRMRYSSAAVSEIHTLTAKEAGEESEKFITIGQNSYNGFNLDWYPVLGVKDVVAIVTDSEGNRSEYPFTVVKSNDPTAVPGTDEAVVRKDGTVILGAVSSSAQVITKGREFKIRYLYDNEVIPQTVQPTSLPTLTAKMQAVNLHAKARRIAVYYSQIAAFQAKNDYGYDLGQQLAQQASGELAYKVKLVA